MPIHPSATVAATARVHTKASIGEGVVIGDFCVIEQEVVIGAHILRAARWRAIRKQQH